MSARDAILGRIHSALSEHEGDRPAPTGIEDAPAAVVKRLSDRPVSTLPSFSEDPTERMVRLMESVQMSVTRVQTSADVVNAVDDYLRSEELDGDVTVSPALSEMDWPSHYGSGAATGNESVGVTPCLAAVAETGSVVFESGEGTPATLNSGPSRTGDIEQTIEIGAHGPRRMHVVLVQGS